MKELGKGIAEVEPGLKINLNSIEIETVEAYNLEEEGKRKINHKKGSGVGYVVAVDSKRIYHAGDTDCIPEMKNVNNIDAAFLPIGGREFTMGVKGALKAASIISPKVIIPMHRYDSDLLEYKNLVEKKTSTKVELLEIGETYQL